MKVVRRPAYRFLTFTLVGNNLTRRGGGSDGGGGGGGSGSGGGSTSFITQLNLTVVELLDLTHGDDGPGGVGPGGGAENEVVGGADDGEKRYDPEGAALYICAVVLVYGISMVLLIASFAKTGNEATTSGYDESQTHKYLREISSLKERNERENYRELKRNIIIRVKQSPCGSRNLPPPPPVAAAASSAGVSTSSTGCRLLQPHLVHHPMKHHNRKSSWINHVDVPPSPISPSDAVFDDDDGDSRTTCSPDISTRLPSVNDLDLTLLTAEGYHQRSRSFDCRQSPSPLSPSSSAQTSPETLLHNSVETSAAYWSNSADHFAFNSAQTSAEIHRSKSVRFSPEIASKSAQTLRSSPTEEPVTKSRSYSETKFVPVPYSVLRSDSVLASSSDRKGPIGRNEALAGKVRSVESSAVYVIGANAVQKILSVAMPTKGPRMKKGGRVEPVTSKRRVRLRVGRGGGGRGRGDVGREEGVVQGGEERGIGKEDGGGGGMGESRDASSEDIRRKGREAIGGKGGVAAGGGVRGVGERGMGGRGGIGGGGGGKVVVGGRSAKVRPQSLTALVMRPWFADHGKSISDPVAAADRGTAACDDEDDDDGVAEVGEEDAQDGTAASKRRCFEINKSAAFSRQ